MIDHNGAQETPGSPNTDWRAYPCICGSGLPHGECCAQDPYIEMSLDGLFAVIRMNNRQARQSAQDGWDEHKRALADWIDDLSGRVPAAGTDDKGPKRVAVIGAGNCSDIPLDILARDFDEIHLYDMDWEALTQVRDGLTPAVAERVHCFSLDVTGLYLSAVPKLVQQLHEGRPQRVFDQLRSISRTSGPAALPQLAAESALVLSINVVSQLFCPFVHSLVYAAAQAGRFKTESDFNAVLGWIRKIGDARVIQDHARLIASACSAGGCALVTTDRFFWGVENGTPSPAAQWLRKPEDMLIQENLERLSSTGPALPGTEIIAVFREHFELHDTRRWLWRFNPEQNYLVEGYELRPINAPLPRRRQQKHGRPRFKA